jgi:DNA-binding CsgD family transcriptional regulator
VLALQGSPAQARTLALDALSAVTPQASASVIARARWVLGVAATADGDFETAYDQFRLMFDTDGNPVHYHVSRLGIADLAAAAARTGRPAAEIVDRIVATTQRQRNLVTRAHALLTPSDALFQAALEKSEQWPFEQAATQLDYAEWLRRQLRHTDARPHLAAALETFRRLGAQPWIDRTLAELRAAGVRDVVAAPNRLLELTPQQQQIVQLAAKGLSNKEIGERLFLSPRTVGSHLYRSFPKLGVTSRGQLHDLL